MLTHCLWEFKLLKLTSKSMWACFTERKVKIVFHQTIHFSAYNEESTQYNRYMHSHHCCSSSNSQKKNQPGSPPADVHMMEMWHTSTMLSPQQWRKLKWNLQANECIWKYNYTETRNPSTQISLVWILSLTSFLLWSKHYTVRVQLVSRLTPNLQGFQNLSFE